MMRGVGCWLCSQFSRMRWFELRKLKLWHETIFPVGAWRVIANESEEGVINDDDVYFYVGDDVDLDSLVPGQEIMLDEMFVVREVV
jgi:hypothetical protein